MDTNRKVSSKRAQKESGGLNTMEKMTAEKTTTEEKETQEKVPEKTVEADSPKPPKKEKRSPGKALQTGTSVICTQFLSP